MAQFLGFGFWVPGFGFWVLVFGFWVLDSRYFIRRAKSSGYAGDLSPEAALQLLRDDFSVLLVDVRSQVGEK